MDTALDAGRPRRLEALDRGGRHALHEDAAQQLQAGGVARMRADHVDRHPERPEELGEALGAGSGRERGRRQARARHHADEGDVRELHRQRRRKLPLELRRGGVQIRVERVAAELFDDAGRRSERNGRRVEAEDDIGAPDGARSLSALSIPSARRAGSQPRTVQPAAARSAAILPPASPRPSTATSISRPRSRAALAGRRRARRTRTAPASRARARRARARAGSTSSTRSLGSAIAPSQSMTTRSPGRISAPPTTTGTSSFPDDALRRALRAHEPRPDRQADRRQLVEVAYGAVDEDPGDALRLSLRRQQLADERDRGRLGARQHEDVARARVRDGGVHHGVVAGRAERDPGRAATREPATTWVSGRR